ncbi:MAG: hypothetical protein ACFE9S_15860 [Candidatus Hermodarchaeota archaeon]
MLKRIRILVILTIFLIIFTSILIIPKNSNLNYIHKDESNNSLYSANQEGAENIILTYVNRRVDVNLYGVVKVRDILTVKNLNNNPISSILVGIPLDHSSKLIHIESKGANENTLLEENTLSIGRLNMVMEEYEMFIIYLDSPLLPHQSRTVIFKYSLRDLATEQFVGDIHYVNYMGVIYPILPYNIEGEIVAYYFFPEFASGDEDITEDWGNYNPSLNAREYKLERLDELVGVDYVEPFLANIEEYVDLNLWFKHESSNKLEIQANQREIFVSPWGVVRVRENLQIKNLGLQSSIYIILYIPASAHGLGVSDKLGKILGVTSNEIPGTNQRRVTIDLSANRVSMLPNTSFNFDLEYYLPIENHLSSNWFQESVEIDLITTSYDYLGKELTITVIIDGCYKIDYITESPEAIKNSQGMVSIKYTSDYIAPGVNKVIQFTFTIDLFNLLLRPVVFIIVFLSIVSIYVVLVKTRKKEKDLTAIKKEYIPVSEIREFCSLFEEKNALLLEIREIEEAAKRKKVSKKTYKNILTKNNSKIDEVQKEIIPFKKILMESSDIFENIIKKLDVLEAERLSVKDSLSLLESRYKRGRLPSRTAYIKLSDDFKKRQKKIDRTIDKLIQQFRSYLL